jgi:glycosyltransferase involved in cell wall biosynthesis
MNALTAPRPRIACLGNMNNNNFSLVRFLRDRGIAADLLRMTNDDLPELWHFHPSCDTFAPIPDYVRTLGWGDMGDFLETNPQIIRDDLKGYDTLIGCGYAPAFLDKAGLALDFILPYGADLYQLPFLDPRRMSNPWIWPRRDVSPVSIPPFVLRRGQPGHADLFRHIMVHRAQAAGIGRTRYVATVNPSTPEVLRRCRSKAINLGFFQPIVYTGEITPDTVAGFFSDSRGHALLIEARRRFDLLVMHHSRLTWNNPPDPYSDRGGDILLKGFARLLAQAPDLSAALVICEYGPDVEATKALAEDLGLADRVIWLPQLPRRDIMVCLGMVDVATSEFRLDRVGSGCVFEILAMAKPLMGRRDDAKALLDAPELYPMMNVREPEGVAAALADFITRREDWAEAGRQGRSWYLRHVVDHSLDTILGHLTEAAPCA